MALNNLSCVDCIGKNYIHPWTTQLLKELTEHEGTEIPWRVDNKYYSATINVSVSAFGSEAIFEKKYEAILLIFASNSLESFGFARSTWERISSRFEPSVKLLVGVDESEEAGDDNGAGDVQLWCVDNGFELVRWTASATPSTKAAASDLKSSRDDLDDELTGIARLQESLQAHAWPDITMKSQASASSAPHTSTTTKVDPTEEPSVEQIIEGLLSGAKSHEQLDKEEGSESFEDMFARFAAMKAHAQNLSHEERKVYAEKVTMAFWKAIGGEDEEETD